VVCEPVSVVHQAGVGWDLGGYPARLDVHSARLQFHRKRDQDLPDYLLPAAVDCCADRVEEHPDCYPGGVVGDQGHLQRDCRVREEHPCADVYVAVQQPDQACVGWHQVVHHHVLGWHQDYFQRDQGVP